MTTPLSDEPQADFAYHLARVKGLLIRPSEEWERIAAENETDQRGSKYVIALSTIPPISFFLGMMLISVADASRMFTWGVRASFALWLTQLITLFIFLFALVAVTRNFGNTTSRTQIGRLAAFSLTPFWVISLVLIFAPAQLLFWCGIGIIWSIYVLHVGVPIVLNLPHEKQQNFTIVSGIVLIVSYFIARAIGSAVLS